jgi:hypothetical protein
MTLNTTIVSATPQPPLLEEEKKARYAKFRRAARHSRFEVKGKEGIHYLWAPREDSSEMTRLSMLDYSIVREPNVKEVLAGTKEAVVKAGGLREDGTYVIGDVILVQCTEEQYQFALQDVEDSHNELLTSAKDNFIDEANKAGVPTFEVTKKLKG